MEPHGVFREVTALCTNKDHYQQWLVFIESRRGQKQETGDLGILNPIYSWELNYPEVAHARAAGCVQGPASTACSEVVRPALLDLLLV